MKLIKLALFLTGVSLLYPQLLTQGAFLLKSCLLKAVFRIYFRSLLYPGNSVPIALLSVGFPEELRLLLQVQAFLKHRSSAVSTRWWRWCICRGSVGVHTCKEPRTCLLVLWLCAHRTSRRNFHVAAWLLLALLLF